MLKSKYNLIAVLLAAVITLAGCGEGLKEEDTTEFDRLSWMLGIWNGEQGDAQLYESWRKKNFRIMEGLSYTTLEGKRVYSQGMRIEQSNNVIYLIMMYNNGADVIQLKVDEISDDKVVFKNEEDTHPGMVTYTRLDEGRMSVVTESKNQGEQERLELTYRKAE